MSQGLSRTAIQAAIQKYGPIFQIHPDDKYLPSSVEWFLSHAILVDSKAPGSKIVHPLDTQLPTSTKEDTRFYLDIEDAVKPGNLPSAKAYVNAFWEAPLTYTDLQFWVFFPYNGHGTARFESLVFNKTARQGDVNLAPLGEHVGDWEYVGLRIDNATHELIGIILSQHGKNIISDKAAIQKSFTMKDGTHPVIYSSLNGHANFATTGPNFTEHRKVAGVPFGLEFNLLNTTAANGPSLNASTAFELVSAPYLTEDKVVSPAWVNYPYRWGPEGTAIHMDTKTLGEIIKVVLGDKDATKLIDTPIVLLASELLHIFVRADINGAGAPIGQSPWGGIY
ncbi:vacuolar protein sorting-associated protein 62 [Amylocarpus encephaloides]|uniref:Vacuolar protein sorting-associated protein 62 n=1 Tax=Amylocarpus encephaloides TaxID=45428 RepID=A0A9P7YJS6_9HELO|nr:vacuolar protein sorting-associated protein 62 [Amylocarpus encephaloides]